MTKQFREAQINWYIYKLGCLNFDWGFYDFANYEKRFLRLEKRAKRELSRPINEGKK